MSIRTTRIAALALSLAVQLLGGLTPTHVLCLHHDGDVTIERAARGAVRCDDLVAPCVPAGLTAAPDRDHCHDAAIAQPGLGQRTAAAAASAPPVVVATVEPALEQVVTASVEVHTSPRGSPTAAVRRTVVLRV